MYFMLVFLSDFKMLPLCPGPYWYFQAQTIKTSNNTKNIQDGSVVRKEFVKGPHDRDRKHT